MLGTQKTYVSTCICTMRKNPWALDTCTGGHCKCPFSSPRLAHPSPAACQAVTPLRKGLGRATSPAKVRFVSGAKDQTLSICEHTFVSFGCTLSGITCLPRQTCSHPELHQPAALLRGLLSPGRYLSVHRPHPQQQRAAEEGEPQD